MLDDGLDDDWEGSGPLLPPEDRLWRHPSEVAGRGARRRRSPIAEPRLLAVGLLSGLIGALLASAAFAGLGGWRQPETRTAVEQIAPPVTFVSRFRPPDFAGIAQMLAPSIVEVRATATSGTSSASGVIIRSDGVILTNAHVVAGARDIVVVLTDGHQLAAHRVGADVETDVAVLKVDRTDLPVATLGTATTAKVGQPVVAIGSPQGLAGSPSVTSGVISALGRQVSTRGDHVLFDMIQTDAPLAPGSSGGALVDGTGAVIGLTTAMAKGEGNAPLGFAVPIDVARIVADQLMTTGKVVHVWLGIDGHDLDPDEARDLGLEGGAVVTRVWDKSPASVADLKRGDVITAVDDRPVHTMTGLIVVLRTRTPGDIVTVAFRRNGVPMHTTATLAVRPYPTGTRR